MLVPGQPDDPHQPRPALVVSEDVRNALTDDLIVVPLFSRGTSGPTRVPLPAGGGGVARAGVGFCEASTTIERDFLRRGPLGPVVEEQILEQVCRAIRRAVGEVVPES
ncbi:MAG: hypothetical protein NVS1B1_10710 [Candidatus Limnocylindrales bacterium]